MAFVENFKKWGWKGFMETSRESILGTVGFTKGKFIGFGTLGRTAGALGIGYLGYKATGNPLVGLGIGAGVGMMALRGRGGLMGAGMKALGPLSMIGSLVMGTAEGGLGHGMGEMAKTGASWYAWDIGLKAVGVALKGPATRAVAGGVLGSAFNPATLLTGAAIAVGIGAGAYYAARGLARLGRQTRRPHFAGGMDAFMTEGAYTMRQRSLQEIQRSHTNARTVLGNEASLMYLIP